MLAMKESFTSGGRSSSREGGRPSKTLHPIGSNFRRRGRMPSSEGKGWATRGPCLKRRWVRLERGRNSSSGEKSRCRIVREWRFGSEVRQWRLNGTGFSSRDFSLGNATERNLVSAVRSSSDFTPVVNNPSERWVRFNNVLRLCSTSASSSMVTNLNLRECKRGRTTRGDIQSNTR